MSLIKSVSIYGSADFAFKALNFITFPLYTHVFAVDEYGILSLVTTLAALVALFLNIGIDNAVQRFYWDPSLAPERRPILVTTGFVVLMGSSLLITGVCLCCIYPFREELLSRYSLPWLLVGIAFIGNIPQQLVQYAQNTIRLHFSPWKFTSVAACQNLLTVAMTLLFVFGFNWGLKGFLLGTLVALSCSLPLGLWFIRKDLVLAFNKQMAMQILKFGYPFIFAGMAFWVFGSMDRWMLGELSTNTEVGLYSIAHRLAFILTLLITAFGQAWSPYVMKLYAEDSSYRVRCGRVLTIWFYLLIVVFVCIAGFCLEGLMIMTPSTYWPAAQCFLFVTLGLVLYGTIQITALGISITKKTYHFSIAAWGSAILNFLLNLWLIPKFHAVGAAIATCAAYGFITAYYLIMSQRLNPMVLEYRKLLTSLIVLTGVVATYEGLAQFPWGWWVVFVKALVMVGVIIFGFVAKIIIIAELPEPVRKFFLKRRLS